MHKYHGSGKDALRILPLKNDSMQADITMKLETMDDNKRDIRLILITTFMYMFSSMLANPLVAGCAESLGAGTAVMGLIGSLMSVISLVCRPFTGVLVDRMSKYSLSVTGIAMLVVSAVGFVLANNSVSLMIARIFGGLGLCLCSVSFSTWLSLLLPKDKMGSGMGKYGIVYAISMAAAPATGVWVYQHYGYKIAFSLSIITSVSGLVLVNLIKNRGKTPAKNKAVSHRIKLSEIFDVKIFPLSALMMLLALPYFATQTYLVQYNAKLGLGLNVSLYFPVYAIVLLVMRLSLKPKFDEWPFKVFYFGGLVCSAMSYVLLMIMKNNITMVLASVCMAGGFGLLSTVSQATSILMATEGKEGLANNTYLLGNDCGCALGALLGGALYKNLPIHMFYPIMMIAIPLGLIIYVLFRKSFDLSKNGFKS